MRAHILNTYFRRHANNGLYIVAMREEVLGVVVVGELA